MTAITGAAMQHRPADRPRRIAALAGEDRDVLEAADSAPSAILPKMLRLSSESVGIANRAADGTPRAVRALSATNGTAMSALNIRICARPPMPCSHLPTRSPSSETTREHDRPRPSSRPACTSARLRERRAHRRDEVRRDSSRSSRRTPPSSAIAYAQRFHAVRNPQKLAEPDRRPLIEPAFERHQPIEIDDDRGLRQVVEQDRQRSRRRRATARAWPPCRPSRSRRRT